MRDEKIKEICEKALKVTRLSDYDKVDELRFHIISIFPKIIKDLNKSFSLPIDQKNSFVSPLIGNCSYIHNPSQLSKKDTHLNMSNLMSVSVSNHLCSYKFFINNEK